MAHGYLGDGYGKYGDRDPDRSRDDDRERDWRGEQRGQWGDQDRQDQHRGERGSERDRGWSDRDRGFMFEGREGRGEDRGFFSRTADEARDWFRQDEHDYRPGGQQQRPSEPQSQQNSRFGSHQDDHYLSWRQQQMDALDRDYQDYCRERQQQFHQDFDSWRSSRQQNRGGSQPSGQSSGQPTDELELTAQHDMAGTSGTSTDPENTPESTAASASMSAATLGTNNSENMARGRRR